MERLEQEKKYLLDLLTQKKKDERRLETLIEDQKLWKKRLELSVEAGREDLIKAAENMLAEFEISIPELKNNMAVLDRDIAAAQGHVQDAQIDDGRSLNRASTDELVRQLSTAAGTAEPDELDFEAVARAEEKKTAEEIASLEADMELEALRKKMKDS